MPGFPYGINPSEKLLDGILKETQTILEGSPETTCCHKAECCKAGCPNMYLVEFVNIHRNYVERLSPEARIELTLDCVRRYLWNQDPLKPKPCVFLGQNNMCKVYPYRHIKCRLYGIIPQHTYSRNATEVASQMGVPVEEMPLAKQCPFVKIKPKFSSKYPNNRVPENQIKKWEKALRALDRRMGMPPDVQDDGYGFLTYHDWHLLFEMGKEWMERLTQLRVNLSDSQKEQFVGALKNAFSTTK